MLDVISSVVSRAGSVLHHTTSVLQPLLWLSFLVSVPCFLFAFFSKQDLLQFLFLAIGALPILAAICAYAYYSITDPRRLHSEYYQLREQSLALLESKGGEIVTQRASIEAIITPIPPAALLEKEQE